MHRTPQTGHRWAPRPVSAEPPELERMIMDPFSTQFTPDWRDRDAGIAARLRHNEAVRSRVPADRLVVWTAGDG